MRAKIFFLMLFSILVSSQIFAYTVVGIEITREPQDNLWNYTPDSRTNQAILFTNTKTAKEKWVINFSSGNFHTFDISSIEISTMALAKALNSDSSQDQILYVQTINSVDFHLNGFLSITQGTWSEFLNLDSIIMEENSDSIEKNKEKLILHIKQELLNNINKLRDNPPHPFYGYLYWNMIYNFVANKNTINIERGRSSFEGNLTNLIQHEGGWTVHISKPL